MSEKRKYDATVGRIAGNLISGTPDWMKGAGDSRRWIVEQAVQTAREIVAETERTEPEPKP